MTDGAADVLAGFRRAKLMRPRHGPGLVSRPRLVRQLEQAANQPVILVVGPAGFGKTTILAEWLATTRTASAWLTVEADDGDVARFVRYVCAAVQRVFPEFGGSTLSLLDQPNQSPTAVGTALADELLDLPEDLILVVDDFQELASTDLMECLTAFLHYPPEPLHLVLASRSDPQLPLARLRGRGLVAELRAADLRFTPEETRELLRRAGPEEPDAAAVAFLHERTEGWAAGLRLASMALQGRTDGPGLAEALSAQGQRYVMDFLMEEVLSRQSPEVHDFLLRMSIVERFNAPLADALLDGPSRPGSCLIMLDHVARANLYLEPIGQNGVWYRYHPLFRELLRHRLGLTVGSAGLDSLHRRSAAWFADNGMIDEATHHLLAAGDVIEAARLVERHVHPTLNAERWPDLQRWLRLLGNDVIRQRPALLAASGWVGQLNGGAAFLRHVVEDAEVLLGTDDRPIAEAEVAGLRAELEALRQFGRFDDEPDDDAVASLQHALAAIPSGHRYARGFALVNLAGMMQVAGRSQEAIGLLREALDESSMHTDAFSGRLLLALAFVHLRDGRLHECERVAQQMLRLATEARLQTSTAWANHFLGLTALEWNQVDRAIEHFEAVLANGGRAHRLAIRESTFSLALAYQAKGLQAEAIATVDRLLESILLAGNTEYLPTTAAFQARLALNRGDREDVDRWLDSSEVMGDRDSLHLVQVIPLTWARALIERGTEATIARAHSVLDALLERAEKSHCWVRVVEIQALRALAFHAAGTHQQAFAAVSEAVRLGLSERFVRSFVEIGPAMAGLLTGYAHRHGQSAYLNQVLAGFAGDRPGGELLVETHPAASLDRLMAVRGQSTLHELLTDRELEVLDCLRRRLSNKEIADCLYISPLTVKRHASNIYDKLGVANRRQAILKASELGVLSP